MKVLLGATAALMLLASPALAQTQTAALPAQCNFTAAPTIPDGAAANNNQMRDARTAVEAWRNTRQAELAACQTAVQALQAQAQAAVTAHNTAATETDAVITRFAAENEEYNARAPNQRRERGSALVH
jgi:Skp family chaperone for outer membrane proteins